LVTIGSLYAIRLGCVELLGESLVQNASFAWIKMNKQTKAKNELQGKIFLHF
jgi:hypothetical protein